MRGHQNPHQTRANQKNLRIRCPARTAARSLLSRRQLRRLHVYSPVIGFTSTLTAKYFTSKITSKTFDCFYLQIRVPRLRSTAESSLRRRLLVCKGFGQLDHALQIGEEKKEKSAGTGWVSIHVALHLRLYLRLQKLAKPTFFLNSFRDPPKPALLSSVSGL